MPGAADPLSAAPTPARTCGSNRGGKLHLHDNIELDSHLPPELGPFTGATAEDPGLLLVPSAAVDCESGDVAADVAALFASDEPIRYADSNVPVRPTP